MRLKKRPRVGIIGGGIFGLSCALSLDNTHDVVVFEQGDDILVGATYANRAEPSLRKYMANAASGTLPTTTAWLRRNP